MRREGRGLVARRTNQVIRGWELPFPPPDFQGRERDLRLNQPLLANDLVNHDYVMKPPLKPEKGASFGPF